VERSDIGIGKGRMGRELINRIKENSVNNEYWLLKGLFFKGRVTGRNNDCG
jgi:hypothetical protein